MVRCEAWLCLALMVIYIPIYYIIKNTFGSKLLRKIAAAKRFGRLIYLQVHNNVAPLKTPTQEVPSRELNSVTVTLALYCTVL